MVENYIGTYNIWRQQVYLVGCSDQNASMRLKK